MYVSECRDAPPYVWPLVKFNRWLDDLMAVTLTELRFHPPDKAAEAFFGALGLDLAIIMSASQTHEKHPAVVADVFTEPNEGRVLEVATGRFNLLWMVYRLPDGRKVLGAGPVMSYYEFKRPMAARLTDEAWRGMIEEGTAPDPPAWTKHFLVRKPKDGD